MLRTLRAFAWMRWRVLMNSLERTGARDTVERLSIAVEQIGPIIAILAIVPSSLALAGLGGYAGYYLAREEIVLSFEGLAMFLFAASGFAVLGPLFMPAIERTHGIRLLLLPIPRRTLYLTQAASALSEPWVLLPMPALVGITAGLAIGGAFLASLVSIIAGILLIAVLVNLSVVSALLLNLVVSNRRRGELLALLIIIVGPVIGFLPTVLGLEHRRDRNADRPAVEAQEPSRTPRRPTIMLIMSLTPSDQYAQATRAAAGRPSTWSPWADGPSQTGIIVPLVILMAYVATLHGIGLVAFNRLLDAPTSSTSRRTVRSWGEWSVRIPALSKAGAAVAQSQLRLAIRTPRGRSILLSPVIVFMMIALVMMRSQGDADLGFLKVANGLTLATFASTICLLALLPFAMNQFAIDRAGLTLLLLMPIETSEILAGKAVGNGLIAAGPVIVCTTVAFIFFPGFSTGGILPWICVPLAQFATYCLLAPVAAALSAIFPRAVDLNSIGRGSNAHGFAALLGVGAVIVAGLPSAFLLFGLAGAFHRPGLTLLLMLVWCGIAAMLGRVLFIPVRHVFDQRRENLGLVV